MEKKKAWKISTLSSYFVDFLGDTCNGCSDSPLILVRLEVTRFPWFLPSVLDLPVATRLGTTHKHNHHRVESSWLSQATARAGNCNGELSLGRITKKTREKGGGDRRRRRGFPRRQIPPILRRRRSYRPVSLISFEERTHFYHLLELNLCKWIEFPRIFTRVSFVLCFHWLISQRVSFLWMKIESFYESCRIGHSLRSSQVMTLVELLVTYRCNSLP